MTVEHAHTVDNGVYQQPTRYAGNEAVFECRFESSSCASASLCELASSANSYHQELNQELTDTIVLGW